MAQSTNQPVTSGRRTAANGTSNGRGPAAEKGPRGEQGVPGIPGTPGKPGPQGDKGSTGDAGAKGPTGEQGSTGVKGLTGDKGPTSRVDRHGVRPASRGRPASRASAVSRAQPATRAQRVSRVRPANGASRVRAARTDCRASGATKASAVSRVFRAFPGPPVRPVRPALPARRVSRAPRASRAGRPSPSPPCSWRTVRPGRHRPPPQRRRMHSRRGYRCGATCSPCSARRGRRSPSLPALARPVAEQRSNSARSRTGCPLYGGRPVAMPGPSTQPRRPRALQVRSRTSSRRNRLREVRLVALATHARWSGANAVHIRIAGLAARQVRHVCGLGVPEMAAPRIRLRASTRHKRDAFGAPR